MTIKKFLINQSIIVSIIISLASASFATVNEGNHGLQLRGGIGGGKVLWGYINQGGSSGDLGTGEGATINLSAMYNYSFFGIDAGILSGNIDNLEWSDKDPAGNNHEYKSTGSGTYTIFDIKFGAKLFTEPGDMGYTFIYFGKRYWETKRSQDSVEVDGFKFLTSKKMEASGDGWIYGFRDFSTIGWDEGLAIVIQTGFYLGKAPVNKLKDNGAEVTYPVKESITFGGELAAGLALQNIGFSVVGGLRGDINLSTFKDSAATAEDESIFGFGNYMFFIEAGMMF